MIQQWKCSMGRAVAGVLLVGAGVAPIGCGHETKVTRVDTGIVTDLSGRELTNSQKVSFVAGKGEREEVRDERREQAVHAREDTQKAPGKEVGADYMLRGSIATILDEQDGAKAVFYQIDLEMVDMENNVKAWFGQKKIKKVIERKRTVF